MHRWTLAENRRSLLRGGEPDVVVADTMWRSLHKADPQHFDQVLEIRAQQGFNVIMLSLLPLYDDWAGVPHKPFGTTPDGQPDYSQLRQEWVERGVAMVERVVERGMTPMLMMQWVDYVPGSWVSINEPGKTMSDEQTAEVMEQLIPAFASTAPIWSTSGDDTFNTSEAVARHLAMVQQVRRLDADALVGVHTGGWIHLPDELAEVVDFVGFQSSHGDDWNTNPVHWNRYLAQRGVTIPAMNLEPAYEGHGYGGGRGRFTAREVRAASWRSMLTGGGAGIGYGAHGVWSWHLKGQPHHSESYSSMPFEVDVAVEFPGARDVTWLAHMARKFEFWRLTDRADLLFMDPSGATAGATRNEETIVIHAPHALKLDVVVDPADYDVRGFDIIAREEVEVITRPREDGRTLIIETPYRFSEHCYVLTAR